MVLADRATLGIPNKFPNNVQIGYQCYRDTALKDGRIVCLAQPEPETLKTDRLHERNQPENVQHAINLPSLFEQHLALLESQYGQGASFAIRK